MSFDLPDNYKFRKLPLELPLNAGEAISCISTHKANLYIGTTKGLLLHYYIFDDAEEYILILKLQVLSGENCAIKKVLVVPDVEMCLVLCNRVIYPYTLPELSPCHIGKIKDVNDMSQLSQVKNPKVKNKHDKIIVYTSNKIRVVQLLPDTVKLLRDINYLGAVMGYSSAAGTLANYSNICLVANDKNYDVVDLQQTRRISLFDYNPDKVAGVEPQIVPFIPQDITDSTEEYMLTICSDASNSMAMFMNALGDVTRGTLAWLDKGYPSRGVVVQWPYVLGLFNAREDEVKLTFSSLSTLEVVYTVDFGELSRRELNLSEIEDINMVSVGEGVTLADQELLDLLMPVSCEGVASIGYKKQFMKPNVILYGRDSFYCLYKESELHSLVGDLMSAIESGDNEKLEATLLNMDQPNSKTFVSRARVVLLLALKKFDELKNVIAGDEFSLINFDPRLFLLVDDKYPDDNEMWKDLRVEKALLNLIKTLKIKNLDPEFKSWLIHKIYECKDKYGESLWQYFRKLLYEDTQSTESTLQIVLAEKTFWQDQNDANDILLSSIESNLDYLVLFEIFKIRQDHRDQESDALQIIELGLSILSGTKPLRDDYLINEGKMSVGKKTEDLVLLIFSQLTNHITDRDKYTKKLLELLKLYPDKGLELLQASKGGKHKSTHRYILQELSSTHNIDTKFSFMKVEYLEQTFLEQLAETKMIDHDLVDELFTELTKYLEENLDKYDVAFENLNILLSTFKLEINLRDRNWPKLSWIEFLHLHGRRDETKELVDMYLKLFELLLVKLLDNKAIKPYLCDQPSFNYLSRCFTETSQSGLISFLLEQGDYSVCEWVALYGKICLPRKTIYLEEVKLRLLEKYRLRPRFEVGKSITQLIKFYLEIDDTESRNASVSHLVCRFGRSYFDVRDLLALLPNEFPIVHIQDYLTRVVLELEADRTDSVMKKMMSKLDSKFTEKVCKDFQESNKGALGLQYSS